MKLKKVKILLKQIHNPQYYNYYLIYNICFQKMLVAHLNQLP